MEALERLKPYKAIPPMETIHRIRQILLDHQIFVIESSQMRDPTTGVCSCRIILGDEEFRNLNIGYNGKGMDARYALASAYAEFIERLQCGATLWKTTGVSNWVPGSFPVERGELKEMALALLRLSFGEVGGGMEELAQRYADGVQSAAAIPFQSYTTGERLSFPAELYNRMAGSNGMASGNTLPEAVLHALSEIFERAALERIFLQPLTPPTIDPALFAGSDILDRLERLRAKGIDFAILDCSLGKGLPVIGLLLKKGEAYHMQFGSDPSPVTALERCLTETFQGRDIDHLPFHPPLRDAAGRALFNNAKREFRTSSGRVPIWVIQGEPSWPFSGFAHPVSRSDEEDMAYYLQILDDLGKPLYGMDCSFLGFPTVRLFVPGMSNLHCPEPRDCVRPALPEEARAMLRSLPALSDDEYRRLALLLREWLADGFGIRDVEEFYGDDILNLLDVFPAGEFPVRAWDDRLLIAAVYLRGGLTEEGDAYLERVIEERNYSEPLARTLRVRFHSPTLTFLPSLWPECPDCARCRARHLCRRDAVAALRERILKGS